MKYFLRVFMVFMFMGMASVVHAETRVYFSPNGGCQEAIIKELQKAHKSIDIAMYSFTSREIAHALIEAKKREVKIRIALDPAQIKDQYSKSRYLISRGFSVKFHMGPGLMHDKFVVIDDRVVLSGSYNWTITADKRNAENLLVITDKGLAGKYEKQFKLIWGQSGEGQSKELEPPVTNQKD
jgi:phosphatidylserine/phosphatidylglycerophosphate/cardiolipin synthase-like enzyme